MPVRTWHYNVGLWGIPSQHPSDNNYNDSFSTIIQQTSLFVCVLAWGDRSVSKWRVFNYEHKHTTPRTYVLVYSNEGDTSVKIVVVIAQRMTEKEISDSLFFFFYPSPASFSLSRCKITITVSSVIQSADIALIRWCCCGDESTRTYSNELDREDLAPRDSLRMCFWSVKLIAVYLAKVNFSLGRREKKQQQKKQLSVSVKCSRREGLNYKPNWVCERYAHMYKL